MNILLIDDDDVDRETIIRAFKKSGLDSTIHVATDGIEGLEALRGTADSAPLPKPLMILLDLNMPRMNGLEFLKELRSDPELSGSVVFVLSTSNRKADIKECYDYKVSGYITKKTAAEDLSLLTRLLQSYWRMIEFSA